MRTYEVIFIVRPDLPEAEVEALVEQMQKGVTESGGEIVKVDNWGKRTLAYRVAGQREGIYVLFEINSDGKVLREFERRLKVTEPVIKVFSVRVDLDRKKIDKIKHKREHRVARRQKRSASSGGGPEGAPRAGGDRKAAREKE
jgi:small subunit ribosomal protein S6